MFNKEHVCQVTKANMLGQRQEGLVIILFLTSFRKTFRAYGQLLGKHQLLSKVQINVEGQKIIAAMV